MSAQKGALSMLSMSMFEGMARRTWRMATRGRSRGLWSAAWAPAALAVLLVSGWAQPAAAACPPATDLNAAIDWAEEAVVAARAYVGDYPEGNNDPNPVRRRFLRVGDDDRPGDEPARGHDLSAAVDRLVELSHCATVTPDRTRIDALLNQAVQLALQGWVVSGNVSLMEGLRISYPRASGNQARPQHNPVPYGSLEGEFDFLSIRDATRAGLLYNEGTRVLLASLRRRPLPAGDSVIMDIDTRSMPADTRDLPGFFENRRFPQYTYYVDEGDPESPGDERIVPIRTQGHLMGQLLQSAARATESVGYRLWTSAYFNGQTRDPAVRDRLLDAAVNESRASAHTQFLSSLALAATVGDEATEGQTPYETLQLHQTRRSVDGGRRTIGRIRTDERPTLPVSAILAGDDQIRPLIADIESGLIRAESSYAEAETAMFTVYESAERMFADEQARENQFINRLTELTGVPADVDELREVAGQRRYREDVASRIRSLLDDPASADSGSDFTNALDSAVQRLAFQRQEVENRQRAVDSYPERIAILEDQLGENRSAIAEAEGKVTAAGIALGKANRHRTTASRAVTVGGPFGVTVSAGISHTYDWGAEKRGRLQADVDRATYTKELRFLEHGVAAQIRGLMLDQDRAIGELRTQVILLGQAEADANRILGDVERLLERLRAYDEDVANLWYRDPTWNVELTAQEEQANRDLQSVIERLYRLGRLLEYRWREPFANPVRVVGGESVSLGPEYENFWSLESVFALPSINVRDRESKRPHQQARDFYEALQQWDTTLAGRRILDGDPITVDISLRQHVLGLPDVKTVDGGVTVPLNCPESEEDCREIDDNRRRFQNILINNGLFVESPEQAGAAKPTGFLLRFPLGLHQTDRRANPLFRDSGAWNHRVGGIRARIMPIPAKNVVDQLFEQDDLDIIFAQGGVSEYVDFSERSKAPDDRRLSFVNLDTYVRYGDDLRRLDRSQPFLRMSTLPARGRADYHDEVGPDGRLRPTADMAGAFWSPFATRWYFQVNPVNGLQIENIDDIEIRMRLVTGRPGCPPGWEDRCGDRR